MPKKSLRICYFGTYRAEYSRNRIMIDGLRRNDVEVIECHEQLWHGIEDRVQTVAGGWKRPAFWWRMLRTYARLVRRYWQLGGQYDVLVVGYPGQLDVFLARLLSWLHRKPLAWDIFMSIYLIALERGLDATSPFAIRLLRQLERIACHLPDRLIIDTEEYAAWFQHTHGVPSTCFHLVPTGADDNVFTPQTSGDTASATFTVVYHGTFIPNHGVNTIVEAARFLADNKKIHFELIGDGPDRQEAERRVKTHQLANVTFVGWVAPEILRQHLANADLCLGVFGVTPQSLMTVQNKIYEGLAMAKPILTGDGPAVRKQFIHGTHLYLCPRNDGRALASAIRELHNNPALLVRLSCQGHARFRECYTVTGIGRSFADGLRALVQELQEDSSPPVTVTHLYNDER